MAGLSTRGCGEGSAAPPRRGAARGRPAGVAGLVGLLEKEAGTQGRAHGGDWDRLAVARVRGASHWRGSAVHVQGVGRNAGGHRG
jgi:hypothetical protein